MTDNYVPAQHARALLDTIPLIINLKSFAGRTIDRVVACAESDALLIVFEGGTVAVFEAEDVGEIVLGDMLYAAQLPTLVELGLITREALTKAREADDEARRAAVEARNRALDKIAGQNAEKYRQDSGVFIMRKAKDMGFRESELRILQDLVNGNLES